MQSSNPAMRVIATQAGQFNFGGVEAEPLYQVLPLSH